MATTTERGYGYAHQQARVQALAELEQEDGQPCARCGQPMWHNDAHHLDLDHTSDRAGYRGLAHRSCNRRAGQAQSVRARARRTATTRASRNW